MKFQGIDVNGTRLSLAQNFNYLIENLKSLEYRNDLEASQDMEIVRETIDQLRLDIAIICALYNEDCGMEVVDVELNSLREEEV
jgi:hypothetical protein